MLILNYNCIIASYGSSEVLSSSKFLYSILFLIIFGSLSTVSARDVRKQYAKESNASRHKALCSAYSDFKPCEVFVYKDFRITANLPRDYLDVNPKSLLTIEICDADAVCKILAKKNLRYVWVDTYISPFTAVVDYKVRYLSESTRPRTAILRFYNRRAASTFGKSIICAVDNKLFPSSTYETMQNDYRNGKLCWK